VRPVTAIAMRSRRLPASHIGLLAAAAAGALLVACGNDEGTAAAGGGKPRLVVSAAASMTEALKACAPGFPGATVRLSFAGSDELAAQIRQGVKPDVFASANTELPDALHEEGLLTEPVQFASNSLVLAVPAGSGVDSLGDISRRGVKLAIGSESVPIGSYTREVLGRLPAAQRKPILANVRSNEPDVKGIVGKLTQKAADAGFVYRSDVDATMGAARGIRLPERLQPAVTYAAGVVKGAKQPGAARRFVDGLVTGGCADALRQASFGPPPG
jgi:molybdate transport system substrate-binding protein